MISVNDIKGRNIIQKLQKYVGDNIYIVDLKKKFPKMTNGLTKSQIDYLHRNIDKKPIKVERVIGITPYLGDEYQKTYGLTHVPKKIYIDEILGDTEKAIHVLGKIFKNQKSNVVFWIPKTQLMDDPYTSNELVEVDWGLLSEYKYQPYDHQKTAVQHLISRNKCILADSMGLGKTKSSIFASIINESKKILVICPSSLKINWMREIEDFDDDISVIYGIQWNPAKYTIINYHILKNFHTLKERGKKYEDWELRRELVDADFDTIIIDEAHYLKNHKSKRGKIVRELIEMTKPKNVWLLTGTPMANRPMDYYNLLKIVSHPISDNWMYYVRRYCEGRQIYANGRKQWITNGASNLEELALRTKNIFLRRVKKDTIDLPDKIIQPLYLKLDNFVEYNSVFRDYKQRLLNSGRESSVTEQLTEALLLRKFLSMEKVPTSIELAENAIEEGKKVIIFTNFNDEMDMFCEYFKKRCVFIRGGMAASAKQIAVDKFQNDPKVRVFVGNIKAAGVGITLTQAEVVIMNSLDWVPGNHEQAEDRAYRIGQDKNVHIYYPLFENTVDTYVWNVLSSKKEVIGTVVDSEINESDMSEIIDLIKND